MPFITIQDLLSLKQQHPHSRLIGLDPGTVRLGVAISDSDWKIAVPLAIIDAISPRRDAESLMALCADRQIGAVVLGYPLSLNGQEGPAAIKMREYGEKLQLALQKNGVDWPFLLQDERMSTMAVSRSFTSEKPQQSGKARASGKKSQQKTAPDSAAAVWILQGALDTLPRN
ncbi:MAG: Holliday junction resolvase RuvX [Alphaproteobacteria bacterium]